MIKTNFTFVVFTYNHEKYILEYLESVRFQIQKYGNNYSIKLVIADDHSSDATVEIIKNWSAANRDFFYDIVFMFNEANIGTCENFINTWDEINSELFHFLAGDDLYSFENVFELSKLKKSYDIVSYMPLYLTDGKIFCNYKSILGVISSTIIYKSFKTRIRAINFIYAPCLFYTKKLLSNSKIKKFVNSFNIIEDLPLQVKISEEFNPTKFVQLDNILIYYRRTNNSAYIIKNEIYFEDKVKIFEYLLETEKGIFKRLLMRNRLFCYKMESKFLSIILNLNYYLYGFMCLINFTKIYRAKQKFKPDVERHQQHYLNIQNQAKKYTS